MNTEVLRKPSRGFRRRVFFYLMLLILFSSVVSGATYYSRQIKFLERERAQRAHTLVTSLATTTELGAYAHEAALCLPPVQRTFREEDVVFAAVYDKNGKEILRLSSPSFEPAPEPEVVSSLAGDINAKPISLRRDTYDDLWMPITVAKHVAPSLALVDPARLPDREIVGLARVGLSLSPAREQLREVLNTGALLTLGLLVLGGLAALLIASKISDPILALARGADEIRAGNLDVRIAVSSRDEIGELAESFNRMAEKLRETMAEFEMLNRNLEGEVLRRTDDIRRSAEFTEMLSAPLDRRTQGGSRAELKQLVQDAIAVLHATSSARATAIFVAQDVPLGSLQIAATRGAPPEQFGPPPDWSTSAGAPPMTLDSDRAILPIAFRGRPEGAIVFLGALSSHAVEFASHAAGQLAIAMANARAYTALRRLTAELTERNQALILQRDQLQEMNRLKSQFLANISHELRTPMNAILGYAELIAEGIYGPTTHEQQAGLQGIEESGRNLLTLINQILDLSKVESGKLEVYVTEEAVHDIVQSVAAEAQGLAKDRPYRVQVHCPAQILIKTDRAKVQQILSNLVANAVKFTEAGEVRIDASATPDGGCKIAVRDTGIGIAKEHQAVIFEEFRQLDGAPTRKYSGTGLGLAIARRFADLLSGSLTVDSTPGAGSTFTLTLPAQPALPAERSH